MKELLRFNTLSQLKDIARSYGVTGLSKLKKNDLAELLIKTDVPSDSIDYDHRRVEGESEKIEVEIRWIE